MLIKKKNRPLISIHSNKYKIFKLKYDNNFELIDSVKLNQYNINVYGTDDIDPPFKMCVDINGHYVKNLPRK